MLNISFPCGAWNVGACQIKGAYVIWHWFSNEIIWLAAFHICCQNLLEELSMSCVTLQVHWERTVGSLYLFSLDILQCSFAFSEFALYPFAVINHNWVQLYFKSCESSQQIMKPTGGLGDMEVVPTSCSYYSFFYLCPFFVAVVLQSLFNILISNFV